MDDFRSVRFVVAEGAREAGDECSGWGRKQYEKIRERRGWSGGRQTQIMEMFASREDQTAAWAFVSFCFRG